MTPVVPLERVDHFVETFVSKFFDARGPDGESGTSGSMLDDVVVIEFIMRTYALILVAFRREIFFDDFPTVLVKGTARELFEFREQLFVFQLLCNWRVTVSRVDTRPQVS